MFNYVTNFKNSQIYNKRLQIFAFLLILSLFFPIRHIFFTKDAYLTGDYSDFTSFSLYLSDILLFTTWFLVTLPRGRDFYHVVKPLKWLILLVFCAFIAHFGLNIRLNGYLLIKWLELIVAYGTFTLLFEQNAIKSLFLKLFVWLCGVESIIALAQFAKQFSIGLYRLGESHLAPNILGVAKIVSGGTTFIRGYGTFPHPNPFSAFLVMGILITVYLLTKAITKKSRILYSILLFINILGLTVTFSRGAYLALGTGLVIFFGSMWFILPLAKGELEGVKKRRSFIFSLTLISLIISFFIFKPFLLTRATFSDQSTIARKFYDVAGIKMAAKNPLFGVGLGESMLHMEQYLPATNFSSINNNLENKETDTTIGQLPNNNQKFEAGEGKTLAPWDKMPPHNYFIIAAAEMGIPAMLILIWIFFWHLKSLIINLKSYLTSYYLLLISIFCAFLILMMFDHYFYTLQQTQLLLWILLALIITEIKTSNA